MNSIAFIDTEVSLKTHEILDIRGIRDNGITFHSKSISDFISFVNGAGYMCGHNILRHDLIYLRKKIKDPAIDRLKVIDTLYLSPNKDNIVAH